MAGSVSEWTADCFEREYYGRSPAKHPRGPESGRYKVIRGDRSRYRTDEFAPAFGERRSACGADDVLLPFCNQ
jgi:formylglycine-generating enzyme required for sulfatase activity